MPNETLASPRQIVTETAQPSSFKDSAGAKFAELVAAGDIAGALEAAKALPQGVNTETPDGVTGLLIAVNHSDAKMVRALLAAGANPNGGFDFAPIALAIAIEGHVIARMLLDAGADPNGKAGGEPAIYASTSFPGATELLLKYHARVDDKNNSGKTAAMFAAGADQWRMVEYLLNNGASIATATPTGITIGMLAGDSRVKYYNKKEVTFLLRIIERWKEAGLPWPAPDIHQMQELLRNREWPPSRKP